MTSILRSTAVGALTALTIATAVVGAPASASAHERGFPVVAGIIGGLAAGALIASAAQAHPAYDYDYAPPPPVYVPAPAYAPAPAYIPAPAYVPARDYDDDGYVVRERQCWREPVRQWGPRHEFIGWRDRKVCR